MDDAGPLTFKIASEPLRVRTDPPFELQDLRRGDPAASLERARPAGRPFPRSKHLRRLPARREVIGMMALRCQRPFSLDQKLGNIDPYLPRELAKVVEIRLLATERDRRGGRVFAGLMAASARYLVRNGYDLAVISGTTRQLRLYRHMGFIRSARSSARPALCTNRCTLTRDRFEQAMEALELSLEKRRPPQLPPRPGRSLRVRPPGI